MFWRDFPTKTALEARIRAIVNPQAFNAPFESSLISDLIVERHYFCSLRGLRPSRLRKLRGYGAKGYIFQGDFTGLSTPTSIDWHTVSWVKCVNPPLTDWDRIVRAMRDRIEPDKIAYRKAHLTCEACGQRPTEEAHHADPTFLSLANSLRSRVSDSEVAECLADWNWFLPCNFAIPADHRVTTIFDELHAAAKLQALCRECHNKTKRKKPYPNDT